jgi:hydrogenase maturation protein HypF
MTGEIVTALGKDLGLDRVVLTGGVFNNRILLSGITRYLRERGFWVYTNRKVPVNDGGIALGQVAVAREFLSGS